MHTLGKSIYHVVDPYFHFWQDQVQAENASLIISSSPKYLNRYEQINKNCLLIPHGISHEEFLINADVVNLINKKYGDFALIVGSITKNVETTLLSKLVKLNIPVVVIGSESSCNDNWKGIKSLEDLHYLGVKHAQELKNYIAAASVCLITYKFAPGKNQVGRSPIKALNYLAQHKAIITTIDTEIGNLHNEAIYRATDPDHFIALVKKGINGELTINNSKINSYLEEHGYPKLISKILTTL